MWPLLLWGLIIAAGAGLARPMVRQAGFDPDRYAIALVIAVSIGFVAEILIAWSGGPLLVPYVMVGGVCSVWIVYLIIHNSLSPDQVTVMQEQRRAEEEDAAARVLAIQRDDQEWAVLNTYLSEQQLEFQYHLRALDHAGIAYRVRPGLLSNLLVWPGDLDRASEAIGVACEADVEA